MTLKAFFILFKGMLQKQIKHLFLEGESLTLNFYFHMVPFEAPQRSAKKKTKSFVSIQLSGMYGVGMVKSITSTENKQYCYFTGENFA